MAFEIIEGFSRTNALDLATASELAYLPADEGRTAFRARLGLDAELISVDNTQAWVGVDDNVLVIALRGSQAPTSLDGVKDWLLTNANNFLILPEGRMGTDFAAAGVGARFHRGFLSGVEEIWQPLLEAVERRLKEAERTVLVAGHSLGGALALVGSWRLVRHSVDVYQIYTYGAPMIGNDTAMQAFEREFPGRIFRYVNRPDMVPLLPTVSLIANLFTHCPKQLDLDSSAGDPQAAGPLTLAEFAKSAVDGLIHASLADQIWRTLSDRITAHDIVTYRAQIEAS
jgi:hypothetical protein